jgi:hypothetical protein
MTSLAGTTANRQESLSPLIRRYDSAVLSDGEMLAGYRIVRQLGVAGWRPWRLNLRGSGVRLASVSRLPSKPGGGVSRVRQIAIHIKQ